ncbi:hypothetical protein [Paenarthrobacter sp. NPDC018779]|uniref:hypothetical protein n=1 Tax=Paenarthrobacter sp. NPDC018779 TaxID=3364375 RepID=UPI0037C95299
MNDGKYDASSDDNGSGEDPAHGGREGDGQEEPSLPDNAGHNAEELEQPTAFVLPNYPGFDFSTLFPKFDLPDFSGLFPKFDPPDISRIFPAVEIPRFTGFIFPKVNIANLGYAPSPDIVKVFNQTPDPMAFTGVSGLFDMPKVDFGWISDLLDVHIKLEQVLPPNWPAKVDLDLIESILNEEGIPLVWIPREEIVSLLLQAPDRTARIKILIENRDTVLADCSEALKRITNTSFQDQLPLARRVISALEAGFDEPAQALAVTVTETAVAATMSGNYSKVKKDVHLNFDDIPFTKVRVQAALAPIGLFYTAWYAHWNKPKPAELSRHITVHVASTEHYTSDNALLAAMLMASVLCALQELREAADQQQK